jgi:spore maturation protein CgeB
VLSEDSVDPDFVGGLVFAPYDELVDACRVLLGDEEKRKQIAEKGFEIVRARTMTEDLRAALQSSTSAKTR